MSPQPLTDAEFESVSEVLERFGDKRSTSLEALDGLLAAVACGPEDIPQSEYLREIWGEKSLILLGSAASAGIRDLRHASPGTSLRTL